MQAASDRISQLKRRSDKVSSLGNKTNEESMNPQELGYDHGNRYDNKNRNPFPKGSKQHQAYEQGHEEGKSDWWEQDQHGVAEDSKPNPYANSLITDPEERSRINDLKALYHAFGFLGMKKARYLDSKNLLKATPKEKALLYRMTDEDGRIIPRLG